jgi:hypothetical protein
MCTLVLLISSELFLDLLHVYPLLQGIDHLLFLFVNGAQYLLLLGQPVEEFPHLRVPLLKNGLQFVPFLGRQPLVLPDVEHSLDLSDFNLQVVESIQHLQIVLISELGHYLKQRVLIICSNCWKLIGNLISWLPANRCCNFLTYSGCNNLLSQRWSINCLNY